MLIYADNAATTRVSIAAAKAIMDAMTEQFGNPSSIHQAGRGASRLIRQSRGQIAALLGANPEEIYFTSGGTEGVHWAIRSAAYAGKESGKNHLITSAIEHPAVLKTVQALEKEGFSATYLPVDSNGAVSVDAFQKSFRKDTALVSIMFANNETGTVQPIREIGEICKEKGVLFHTDAVQAAGQVPIDVGVISVDYLSISAHKFHGPKGVGALYARKGAPLLSLMEGGAQERALRGGTENVPGIVGMTVALEEACANMDENNQKTSLLRDFLISEIEKMPACRINGNHKNSLPGIISCCFECIEGESLVLNLDMMGICASSGSACASGNGEPSHVLLAMGLPHELAKGSLRVSLCADNTMEEMHIIAEKLSIVIERLRAFSAAWNERVMLP